MSIRNIIVDVNGCNDKFRNFVIVGTGIQFKIFNFVKFGLLRLTSCIRMRLIGFC